MTKAHSVSRRSFVAGTGALALLGAFGLSGCSTLDERPKKSTDLTYDAVIVGCGGAGMSAAIAAYDKGLTNIVILEKMKVVGGNTNFSSSGMNASETKFQAEQGIQDSNDLFAQETLVGGHRQWPHNGAVLFLLGFMRHESNATNLRQCVIEHWKWAKCGHVALPKNVIAVFQSQTVIFQMQISCNLRICFNVTCHNL